MYDEINAFGELNLEAGAIPVSPVPATIDKPIKAEIAPPAPYKTNLEDDCQWAIFERTIDNPIKAETAPPAPYKPNLEDDCEWAIFEPVT